VLTSKQYELVGKLAIHFNDLEIALEICVVNLMGAESLTLALRIVRSQRSFDRKRSMLSEILKAMEEESEPIRAAAKRVAIHLQEVKAVAQERNTVVHSHVHEERHSGETVLRTTGYEVVSDEMLAEFIERVHAATLTLYDLANQLVAELSAERFEKEQRLRGSN
jgi:hypothetical protein